MCYFSVILIIEFVIVQILPYPTIYIGQSVDFFILSVKGGGDGISATLFTKLIKQNSYVSVEAQQLIVFSS